MKANLKQIQDFLANKKIGFVGASRDSKKFGNQVIKQLLKLDYQIIPVHRTASSIEELPCVKSIQDLPNDFHAVCLVVPKQQTDVLLREAIEKGIKNIWIQQFSEGPETFSIAKESGANIITGRCIFMYTQPNGIHKFHQSLNKLFGVHAH